MTAPRRRPPRKRAPSRLPSLGRPWITLMNKVIDEEPICRLRIPGTCTIRSKTADHIIPRSRRVDLTYERRNLRGACIECNTKLGDGGNRKLARLRAEGAAKMANRKRPRALDFFP